MTLQIDGVDVMNVIEIATWVGSIVAMLVIGLIVYLMVRPVRHRREERPARDAEALDAAELIRTMELMERRLTLLERAIAEERQDREQFLTAGTQARETRRTK